MLILDSCINTPTYSPKGRALDYCKVIDDFVAKIRELRQYELSAEDWRVIKLVSHWLKAFRAATTQMSTTKRSMLSSTQAIFHGLQESLQESLHELPNNTPPHLKDSLIKAHRKLSDYYMKFDESPFYIWSSLLDPQISFEGLSADCGDDHMLQSHLEHAKNQLYSETLSGSPQKAATHNFRTSHVWLVISSLFLVTLTCSKPLSSIGSAVAVECIFSGGRDTISLRRASLQPNTIRTLMLVKQRLRLARNAITVID
ncbi:hypothetical protein DFH29DRAFT_991905 [Suillus ampliporus]|nr:hypothetical protein DFH29DRAFT_991905 [Suillus ampliporus]